MCNVIESRLNKNFFQEIIFLYLLDQHKRTRYTFFLNTGTIELKQRSSDMADQLISFH